MGNDSDDGFAALLESVLTDDDVNETNHNQMESSPKADENEIDHNQNNLSPNAEVNETDHNQNRLSTVWRGKTKREQQCAKGNSTKKPCATREPSTSRQQPRPRTEDFKEILKVKSVPGGLKVVRDALHRRKMIDKLAYSEALMRSNQMPWPIWPDADDIEIKIDKINGDYKNVAATSSDSKTMEEAELKRRLVEVREDLEKLKKQEERLVEVIEDPEKLKKQELKYLTKEKKFVAVFANSEGFSEALRKKLSSELPEIVLEETATKGPATEVEDSITREQLQATFSNLKDELYAMDNDKVDVSEFQGLEEALKKTRGWKTPGDLELTALRIEKARGKATEFSHEGIQVLVCAAIQEMENVPIENWNWGMLKKWGATLNKANKFGFRVEFAEKLLKNSLFAYLGHSNVE